MEGLTLPEGTLDAFVADMGAVEKKWRAARPIEVQRRAEELRHEAGARHEELLQMHMDALAQGERIARDHAQSAADAAAQREGIALELQRRPQRRGKKNGLHAAKQMEAARKSEAQRAEERHLELLHAQQKHNELRRMRSRRGGRTAACTGRWRATRRTHLLEDAVADAIAGLARAANAPQRRKCSCRSFSRRGATKRTNQLRACLRILIDARTAALRRERAGRRATMSIPRRWARRVGGETTDADSGGTWATFVW